MTDTGDSIAVVGAGIGGLAAALFLSRAGRRVTLIERRAAVETEGAGLQLSPNASRLLIAAGLGPALARRATQPERVVIRDGRGGRVLGTVPLGDTAQTRYGAPYYVIHRADLAQLLLDAVRGNDGVRMLYGRAAESCAAAGAGVTLTLRGESGRSEALAAGAVIAADGIWGALARQPPPRAAGFAAWRALVPARSAAEFARANEVSLWLGRGAHLVHYPVRNGEAVNIVAVLGEDQPARGWSRPGDAGRIAGLFGDWHAPLPDLIAAAPDWRCWSLFDRAPMRRWGAGAMTALGDAAHAALPFLAQGAAMAVEDAATLATTLDGIGAPFDAALRRYERQRRRRTARVQRAARRNAVFYHAGWPLSRLRDMALAASSPNKALARWDWLYGWRPDARD